MTQQQTREQRSARTRTPTTHSERLRSIAFDLRTIVSVLFTVYGVVCVVWGVAFDSAADSRRSGGIAVNLWTGIGMLVVAAAFFAWSWLRPLPIEDASQDDDDGVDDD